MRRTFILQHSHFLSKTILCNFSFLQFYCVYLISNFKCKDTIFTRIVNSYYAIFLSWSCRSPWTYLFWSKSERKTLLHLTRKTPIRKEILSSRVYLGQYIHRHMTSKLHAEVVHCFPWHHVYIFLVFISCLFFLELSKKKKKKKRNIEIGHHYSQGVRGEVAVKLLPRQFPREMVPKIKESLCVFQEKFFVETPFRSSIGNITIYSNWLRQIPESSNKVVLMILNEFKGTTRNEYNNFAIRRSSFLLFFHWSGSVSGAESGRGQKKKKKK